MNTEYWLLIHAMRQNVFRNMKGVKKFPCIYAWEVGSGKEKSTDKGP